MTYTTRRLKLPGSSATRIALALACAGVLGILAAPAAVADEHDRGDQGYRNDRGYDHGDRGERGERGERGYEHHRYPVYAPPPVYYGREESPGISLFIPWDVR